MTVIGKDKNQLMNRFKKYQSMFQNQIKPLMKWAVISKNNRNWLKN